MYKRQGQGAQIHNKQIKIIHEECIEYIEADRARLTNDIDEIYFDDKELAPLNTPIFNHNQ